MERSLLRFKRSSCFLCKFRRLSRGNSRCQQGSKTYKRDYVLRIAGRSLLRLCLWSGVVATISFLCQQLSCCGLALRSCQRDQVIHQMVKLGCLRKVGKRPLQMLQVSKLPRQALMRTTFNGQARSRKLLLLQVPLGQDHLGAARKLQNRVGKNASLEVHLWRSSQNPAL